MRIRFMLAAFGLAAGLGLSNDALATYAVPKADTGSGVVQAVNYAARTITVDGHVYKLSDKAIYIGGGTHDLGGLRPGMTVHFVADGPATGARSHITNIVVLPPKGH
ncbi:MAG: hypothetical protein ACRETQ_04425 [Gammaproteobacteria bacterium]